MKTMHYLARGIIQDQDYVLFAKMKDRDFWFLPGGHIEFGESAQTALMREIQEELGLNGVVKSFVGSVEHLWPEPINNNHEINVIFVVEIPNFTKEIKPVSRECDLSFEWLDVNMLDDFRIEPKPLVAYLKKANTDKLPLWGSTLSS